MKKSLINKCIIFLAFLTVCSIFCFRPYKVDAAEAEFSLSVSSATVNLGDTVVVTIECNSSVSMAYLQWNLSYPSAKLEHVPGDGESKAAGKIGEQVDFSQGDSATNVVKTYKFKAIAVGQVEFKVDDFEIYRLEPVEGLPDKIDTDMNIQKLNIVEKSKSSNAYLSSLSSSVGTISPAFSKDVTEYNITVSHTAEVVYIYAKQADDEAKLSISGDEFTDFGENVRVITVEAPDGTVKKYTVRIYRENPPATTPPTEVPKTERPATQMPTAEPVPTEFVTPEVTAEPTDVPVASTTPDVPTDDDGDTVIATLTPETFEFTIFDIKNYISKQKLPVNVPPVKFIYSEQEISGIPETAENEVYIVYAQPTGGEKALYTLDLFDGSMQRFYGNIFIKDESTPDVNSSVKETDLPADTPSSGSSFSGNGGVFGTISVGIIALALGVVAVIVVIKHHGNKAEETEEEF